MFLLQLSSCKGWQVLKSDAKAAFLQTGETQRRRQTFGRPVPELRDALGLSYHQAVQILKAAYGLTVAPKEFYLHVDDILANLGLHRLHVDPAIWVLREWDDISQSWEVYGAVGAHVDDFLLIGNEDEKRWHDFLEKFHKSLTWSPWEFPPMSHCGIWMEQDAQGTWHLGQSEFCSGVNQVQENGAGKDLTPEEVHQCRAVLGATQWRCYQTGPHD